MYRARMRMGEFLAETAKKELAKAGLTVDVVIPVSCGNRARWLLC